MSTAMAKNPEPEPAYGHLVRLTYQSQFANGLANEQFLWRIEKSGPALLGYHVNSALLVT